MAILDGAIIEAVRFVPVEVVVIGRPAVALDVVRIGEVLVPAYGMVVLERLRLRSTLVDNAVSHIALSDTIDLLDHLFKADNVTLVETVGVAMTQDLKLVFQIIEQLDISSTLVGNGAYNLSLTQSMRLIDTLARYFGADVTEAIELAETLVGRTLASAHIDESVGIEPLLTPQLLFSVTVEDGIAIEPEQLVNMLFQPTMLEGVEFEAGYLAPDGSFTTWVMNTRTGGVTEYQDYVFNSFAQMGNKYLGASDAGLFELLGDDDDGDDIVSRIKGGFMQFGGTQLSRLKEAYIAARGEGEWVLKIITGDDVYNYSVSNRSMRSTKFHMGKGQRARYFAYELISAGQDFDLDTLEFVPIVVQRRV